MSNTDITPAAVAKLYDDPELGQLAWDATAAGDRSELWCRLGLAVAARTRGASFALQTQTINSSTFTMWRSAVVEFAGVQDADARRFFVHEMQALYNAGSTAAEAAVKLARVVDRGLIDARSAASAAALRRIIRDARKR